MVYDRLLKEAERACHIFDANGMVRVEFIYSEEKDAFYVLEVNTHPGMTPMSICPEIAAAKGISYTELVKNILIGARFE